MYNKFLSDLNIKIHLSGCSHYLLLRRRFRRQCPLVEPTSRKQFEKIIIITTLFDNKYSSEFWALAWIFYWTGNMQSYRFQSQSINGIFFCFINLTKNRETFITTSINSNQSSFNIFFYDHCSDSINFRGLQCSNKIQFLAILTNIYYRTIWVDGISSWD